MSAREDYDRDRRRDDLREAAIDELLAPDATTEEQQRAIFDAGFAACRAMGDNHIHYRGEQADRIFAKAMKRLARQVSGVESTHPNAS